MSGKKRTYQVNVHYDLVVTQEVKASSKEEAEDIAKEMDFELTDSNVEVVDCVDACVTDIRD